MPAKEQKDPAAVSLGRRGGLARVPKGVSVLSPEERSERARQAAVARWAKKKAEAKKGKGSQGAVMPEHNGTTRIDRIERAIEALIEGHARLTDGHQQFLAAQVSLADAQHKSENQLTKLAGAMAVLAAAQKHSDERLDIVVKMMDDFIRHNPR